MSRVITSSEVDRLHEQVRVLEQRVGALEEFISTVRGQLLLPSPPPSELFEDLREYNQADLPDVQSTRGNADSVVESLIETPIDEAGPSDQDGDFLQP